MNMRKLFTLTAAVAVAGLIAACSGGGDGGDASGKGSGGGGESAFDRLRLAATETQEAGTARMAFTVAGMPDVGEITAEGAVDLTGNRGTMQMHMPEVRGQSLGTIDAIFDGTVIYMKFPPPMSERFGNKPWIKMDVGKLMQQQAGIDMSAFAQGTGNPSDALAYLRGAGADTTEVGEDTIRGAHTTHYRTTIDPQKMADAAGGPAANSQKLADMLGDQKLRADVWVDDQGRMRKMTYSIDMSKIRLPNGSSDDVPQGVLDYTFELYDFGTKVNISIPPADQTADLQELLEQAGG